MKIVLFLLISIAIAIAIALSSAPASAQALGNDAKVNGEITRIGQTDNYTFNASTGDTVFITVADVDQGSFVPSVRLFDSNGAELGSNSDSLSAGILDFDILSGGQHTITIRDLNRTNTGRYVLRLASVPRTNELGRLQGTTSRTETLELGDIDTLTFFANAGEHVFLDFRPKEDTSISFALRLYDPQGELFTTRLESLTSAALKNFEVETTGIWTVVINDRFLDDVGEYDIYFALIPDANEKGTLPNDARRSATLHPGDMDTWKFYAESGDNIHLSATDSDDTGMTVDLFLYGPNGEFLAADRGSVTAFIRSFEITEDGLHTIVVKDLNRNNTERYELHFAKAPGAAEFGILSGSTSLFGDIHLGDIDTFAFGAAAGSNVTISIADLDDSSFSPHFHVYDADGKQVATASRSNIASIDFEVEQTGTHSIILQDNALDDIGNYSLDFLYIGATPTTPVSSIALEPLTWYMLGVPGSTGGTLGELFDGTLDLALYGDNQAAGGWIMFGFEATQRDSFTGRFGTYRALSLSEPVPQGTGFWLIHVSDAPVLLTLPPGTTNATGVTGGGCAAGSSCTRTALDAPAEGGWTIGAVPSVVVPSVSDFRFQTSAPANLCTGGCSLEEAANIEYAAPNGFFVYDSLNGVYRLRASTDSIAPWSGFWVRANSAAVPGAPELLIPVK